MGACATKPKVLKEEGGQAPVPEPEPAAVEAATVEDMITKSRGVDDQIITPVAPVVVEEKEKKIVVDDEIAVGEGDGIIKVDDDQSTKKSLSNLFKEYEIEKATEAIEKASAEVVKQESSETEKPEELTVKERSLDLSNPAEPEKLDQVETEKSVTEIPVEMEKHDQVEAEKTVPVETEKSAVLEKQEEPLVTETKPEEPVKPEEPIVIEKTVEISDTKLPTAELSEKPVEPAVSLPVVDAPAKETEKVIAATPSVETKTGNETSAEKKPEESKVETKTSNETSAEKKPEESKDSTVTA
ncbi:uncharacterized protein LOC126657723 [Mercurialis annua]|uniref:uncharacterized protein LOC126657723 n=1 Tax=Mercurialis annua TaxID=3986 RepID=UPI00215E80C2|nr:uncharacterized protein LOC126657723 [Mercurialis annua]